MDTRYQRYYDNFKHCTPPEKILHWISVFAWAKEFVYFPFANFLTWEFHDFGGVVIFKKVLQRLKRTKVSLCVRQWSYKPLTTPLCWISLKFSRQCELSLLRTFYCSTWMGVSVIVFKLWFKLFKCWAPKSHLNFSNLPNL